MALVITKDNFKEIVLDSNIPVMVDFWASWCGPCKMIGPVVETIATELDGVAKVGKVNVDEQGELAAQFNVMTIPTIIIFKNGAEVTRSVGFKNKDELKKLLA